MEWQERTQRLIGEDGIAALRAARVILFGVGGVGGAVAEALLRAGVGTLALVDADCVEITNVNRQIVATRKSVGRAKVEVMRERALEINPSARVEAMRAFYSADNAQTFSLEQYDYVADAIDSVRSKLLLVQNALAARVPVISAMGAGNKLDPARFRVEDISRTSVCPLARVMRRELKKVGIEHLKVVYSDELPVRAGTGAPGSISFVPAAAGLVMAGEIVRDLLASREG